MDPVVHFEMPFEDKKRMVDFYAHAFGWKSNDVPNEPDQYTLMTTTEVDEKGWPKEVARINGGFYAKQHDKPNQYPTVVIAIKDIDESMEKIVAGGGKILGEPIEVPGYGTYVTFLDTEGNRVSMMQPKEM